MQEMKPEEREEWLAKQNLLITKAFISMAMPIRACYIDGMVDYGMPHTYSMCKYSMRTQCQELEGSQTYVSHTLIVRLVKIDLLRILAFTLERINMKVTLT